MRGILSSAQLCVCLFVSLIFSFACQSSSSDSTAASGDAKKEAGFDSTTFLAQLKQIQDIATAPTSDTVARNEKALAKIREFNKAYPAWEPISRDSMEKVFMKSPPKEWGPGNWYQFRSRTVYTRPAKNNYSIPYEDPSEFEELIPHVYFPVDKKALIAAVYYIRNVTDGPTPAFVIDRGYLGGFGARAHWYYLKHGFIGAEFRDIYERGGTVDLTWINDEDGTEWVPWADRPYNRRKKLDNSFKTWLREYSHTSQTYVKDRWQIVIERGVVDHVNLLDSTWMKSMGMKRITPIGY